VILMRPGLWVWSEPLPNSSILQHGEKCRLGPIPVLPRFRLNTRSRQTGTPATHMTLPVSDYHAWRSRTSGAPGAERSCILCSQRPAFRTLRFHSFTRLLLRTRRVTRLTRAWFTGASAGSRRLQTCKIAGKGGNLGLAAVSCPPQARGARGDTFNTVSLRLSTTPD